MTRIVLIADDLTGAMDSGLQFSKRGCDTLVSTSWQTLPEAEVVVVDTDSRDVAASTAYARLRAVARRLAGRRLFKKVDSTMRGNVGYELRALLEVRQPRAAVVAPAFPASGRSTLHGVQRADGRPLELTFFARDPRWPMTQSHLPTLLMQQSGREVAQIDLEVVERGALRLAATIAERPESIVVVDALQQLHVRTIAEALVALGDDWLPCGSAGLAEEWANALGLGADAVGGAAWDERGPVLAAAGSRNEVTLGQLRRAIEERGITCVQLAPRQLWDPSGEVDRLVGEALGALREGSDVLLTSSFVELVPGRGHEVADLLARAVRRLTEEHRPGGIFVTGGDIAMAVCEALEVRALRVRHEVQPGVPGGELVGGPCDGLRVVTKAGGFGDERALLDALDYLHGRLRHRGGPSAG